jgi:hypothetical protein
VLWLPRETIFLSFKEFGPVIGATQPPVQVLSGASSPDVKLTTGRHQVPRLKHVWLYSYCPSTPSRREQGKTLPYAFILFRRVRKIVKGDHQLRHVCLSVRLAAWNNSALSERILMKFDVSVCLENHHHHDHHVHEGLSVFHVP